MMLTGAAAFSVLLDAVMTVLVINLASFFIDKDLVSVCYGDELLGGFFIAATRCQLP
jgi:hypothetical protein